MDEGNEHNYGDDEDLVDDLNVFAVYVQFATRIGNHFERVCVGFRAQNTVICKGKAEHHAKASGDPLDIRDLSCSYRFGNTTYPGLGITKISLPVSHTHFADIDTEVVDIDIPFLLGPDVLTKFK